MVFYKYLLIFYYFFNLRRLKMSKLRNGKSCSQSGFTLVELSIVLVIIGLIVSSVLVGQDLVTAAAVRNVIKQKDSFDTAVNTYRAKYNVLQGDGAQPTGLTTCYGNGDGKLSGMSATLTAAKTSTGGTVDTGDSACFWMDLGQSGAGYLPGAYTGVVPPTTGVPAAANSPQSKLSNQFWAVFYDTNPTFTNVASNAYLLGATYATTALNATLGIDDVSATSIDTKIDDGIANTGTVRGVKDATLTSLGSTTTYTAGVKNSLVFKMQAM